MNTAVTAAKESTQQPTDEGNDQRAEECAPKSRYSKTGNNLSHQQQHEAVQDENEKTQAQQDQRRAQNEQDWANEGIHNAKQQRSAEQAPDVTVA